MSTTPTLDPERTDRLRTFLVVEAASSTASGTPARRAPARRRLALGVAAVALLGGGLVAAQAVGGPAPAAIAVEVDGAWITVRLVDIDADPDAVVDDLRAAGFRAEHRPLHVDRSGDGVVSLTDSGVDSDHPGGVVGVASVGVGDGEGGEHGVVGLTVALPEGALSPAAPGDVGPTGHAEGDGAATDGPILGPDGLEEAGVRFEPDGSVSFRQGTDVTIVVQTEA